MHYILCKFFLKIKFLKKKKKKSLCIASLIWLPCTQDGSKEEGKYKNNVLITSNKKKHVFLIRSAKFRERIEAAVAAAQRAAKIAMQKEDIGISRWATG